MRRPGESRVPGALLVLCFAVWVSARGQAQQRQRPGSFIPVNPISTPSATITVVVYDQAGAPLDVLPRVSLSADSPQGPRTNIAIQQGNQWVFMNLLSGVQYEVQVEAPGFQTSRQYVNVPDGNFVSQPVEFYLVPENGRSVFGQPAGEAILAPRVQKEVQQGVKELAAKKFDSAEKHLEKALAMAPANPLVNYLMGACWLRAGKMEQAAPYLEKAVSLDPKQTEALLALGTVRYDQGNNAKAIETLKQAVESAPESWQAHWLLAAALLRSGDNQRASEEAASALKYGKDKAEAAMLIRGEALANLGKRDEARKTFSDYLQRNPHDPQADKIRAAIAELAKPPAPPAAAMQPQPPVAAPSKAKADSPAGPPPAVQPTPVARATSATPVAAPVNAPAALPAKETWAPADVDAVKPEVIPGVACQLPGILKRAGTNVAVLVANLEKFSATESFQAVEIGPNGQLSRPVAQKFSYMAFIQKVRPHLVHIEELREPDPAAHLGGEPLMSIGVPALALVFHPDYSGNFTWKCEGMGEWKGQPAWAIHFQQRPDRPLSPIAGFVTRTGDYRLGLKGRAWVAANGDQVLNLTVDLVKPLEPVQLEREHFAIDYELVTFHGQRVALWLPESIDAYFRYRGHSYHQYSRFSQFELFWTAARQRIDEPKQVAPKN